MHAAAALGRRAAAVDDAPDDRARHAGRRRRRTRPSRAEFIGRGRSAADPDRDAPRRRSATARARCSIRSSRSATRVVLEPDETVRIHLVTGVAETRDGALALIEKYRDRHLADRVFELAWTHSQVVLRRLDATERRHPALRPPRQQRSSTRTRRCARRAACIARNRRGQSGLWALRHLRRPADRAGAHRRRRAHRARAPARAGARVLAPEGPGRRPGHLERGPVGLPPGAAGRDHGA